MTRTLTLLAAMTLVLPADRGSAQQSDPFLWLEEVESERALEWVTSHNAATAAELSRSDAYQPIFDRAVRILDSEDRIPLPSIRGEHLYNFWQDAGHERGIWRRTSWDAYSSGAPQWETVLDIDALAEAEGVPWAWGGSTCLSPNHRFCLVQLSRGGADAVEVREFDTESRTFVEGGFRLPEAKQSVAWIDENTLLIATDFGDGSMTTSGYARIAKIWRRGTPLDSATAIFEAPARDMGVWVTTLETADRRYQVVMHRPDFYTGTTWLLHEGELIKIDVPLDADLELLRDQLLVRLRSPWTLGDRTLPAASLVAIGIDRFLDGARDFTVVLEPGEREAIESISTTRDHLLVSMLDNVRGELRRYTFTNGEWSYETVPAPGMGSIDITSTSPSTNRYFFTYSGFTQPTTLYLASSGSASPSGSNAGSDVQEVQRMPEMFDASDLVVEQYEAASKDGTPIPYFIIHREGIAMDGRNPTLLYAYGGFEVPMTPGYSAINGAAWLERGGVYVVANIRGGGEFGPEWHRAGLKENRQRVYDDFIAVAEALVDRSVTSRDHLGIMGGSNGGLLVGVAFTQRPDLFNAVVIQVPLLDMQRYNKLLAGASWMAEYGDPDKPEEWAYISRYSPYHNLQDGADYPRVLFTTTTRDDRVHPGHARKMAAKMESMSHPLYYFEQTEGGHGSGVTTEQRAEMYALTYAYLWEQLAGQPPAS